MLESQNVASLAKHFAAATSRTVHCAVLQETCVDKTHIDTTKARFTGAGWDSDVSVPCPDTAKPTAGVATAVKHHGHCSQPHTHAVAFTKALSTGRIRITVCNCGGDEAFYVCNLYGCTNGENCTKAAAITNELIKAADDEFQHLPPLPKILCGDINATAAQLPALRQLFSEGWTDLGEHADWWGGTPGENTCHTHAKAKPTRIDGIVANTWMLPLIQGVRVFKDEHIPTHAVFEMSLSKQERNDETTHLRTLPTLRPRFDKLM